MKKPNAAIRDADAALQVVLSFLDLLTCELSIEEAYFSVKGIPK